MSKDLWLKRVRNICGLLGMLLPFLAIFSVLMIENHPEGGLNSISATYYLSPALAGVLTSASIVLMCYDGYSKLDSVITTVAGVFGIGIVLFPCTVGFVDGNVGFFQLPMSVSNTIHCTCASVFFCLLAFNSFFLFTRTDDFDGMTDRKRLRNIVYRICAVGMLIFMIFQVLSVTVLDVPGYCTMINETAMLFFFGLSWLTKGGVFLADKE